MNARHKNAGLRKLCSCSRRQWAKCQHSWYFSFQCRNVHHRFSLDHHLGRHVAGKTEAQREADTIKAAIRNGDLAPTPTPTPDANTPVTLDMFSAVYLSKRPLKARRDDGYRLKQLTAFVLPPPLGQRLGAKALARITEDDLETFLDDVRARGRTASTCNKYVQLMKHSFRWATRKGYIKANPITEDSALKRAKCNHRVRRLIGDEEARLLAAAAPRMQRLIVAAIESGCRLGELLSLLWKDAALRRGEITIRAANAKDDDNRHIPISARGRCWAWHGTIPQGSGSPPRITYLAMRLGASSATCRRRGRPPC